MSRIRELSLFSVLILLLPACGGGSGGGGNNPAPTGPDLRITAVDIDGSLNAPGTITAGSLTDQDPDPQVFHFDVDPGAGDIPADAGPGESWNVELELVSSDEFDNSTTEILEITVE